MSLRRRDEMIRETYTRFFSVLFLVLLVMQGMVFATADKKALTYQDIMKFKEIKDPVISDDGEWAAYEALPDRGDGEVVVKGINSGKEFRVPRGSKPVFSKNMKWVAMVIKPELVELEKISDSMSLNGMALLDTQTGKTSRFEEIKKFSFSSDSRWLAFLRYGERPKKKERNLCNEKTRIYSETDTSCEGIEFGSSLMLIDLNTGEKTEIPHVLEFAFGKTPPYLVFSVANPEKEKDGIYYIDLDASSLTSELILLGNVPPCSALVWNRNGDRLAFLLSKDETGEGKQSSLWIWNSAASKLTRAVSPQDAPDGWHLSGKNEIKWSKDGERLFFGYRPDEFLDYKTGERAEAKEGDLYDLDEIQKKSEVDVWHWNDPRISINQKREWYKLKDKTYRAVYHFDSGKVILLADKAMPKVRVGENPHYALGISNVPYLKEMSWYGRVYDLYVVNLKDGSRKKILSRLEDRSARTPFWSSHDSNRSSLSPSGRYVVYYQDEHWYLYDIQTETTRNLTKGLNENFSNEAHDYPFEVPAYGMAGWMDRDSAVLLYDKYDIWKFSVKAGKPVNITGGFGRTHQYTLRIIKLRKSKADFGAEEELLLSAFHNQDKHWGFYSGSISGSRVKKLLEEKKKFKFLAKASKADALLYTRETYDEFPDLWVSDPKFTSTKKISGVNPQKSEFAWGSAELVEWKSVDGVPLQGALIKPGNFERGKKYPVIVYFYRFSSQRVHEWNQMAINHRPCFPFYASNGYVVFLPDIKFQVGHPGYSATKCLVPGVQKLIDMGVADPDAVALHGHSWGGYQTALVVTQTNIFACTVAGAPVSNMTSAYSGIRWESGLARQFQYEQEQSRIGASLWERRDLYIDNSPVFFADRIQTPLLIIFGDVDGAVPWYQGIELYLAMRRLEKDCVFLQYRCEPHHPRRYPNKLDWFKKMKEYFDHYLKGKKGPDWITEGIPYQGH